MDKFLSRRLTISGAQVKLHEKNVHLKPKYTSNRDTTRNNAFGYLLLKQGLQLSFQMCFPQKALRRIMLQEWNFTKNKICHRCFDNNLQKVFPTKVLENSNGLLIVILMVHLRLKLQIELVH